MGGVGNRPIVAPADGYTTGVIQMNVHERDFENLRSKGGSLGRGPNPS